MRRPLKYIGLAVGLAVLCSCANHIIPITNLDNQPMPVAAQRMAPGDLTQRIEHGAGAAGWKLAEMAPGQLQAVYIKEDHVVTVRISFTPSAYSIDFVSSVNMDQGSGKIHHKYKEWIDGLSAAIAAEVGRTA